MTDEIDVVRRLRPAAHGPTPALVADERNALMAIIQTDRSRTTDLGPAQRRRRPRWALPAAVLVVGATAAAGWSVLDRDVRHAAAFVCLADGVVTILPNAGTPPVEACARAWEAGAMQAGTTVAPPLVACISPAGTVTVIEGAGDAACEAADMAPWEDAGDVEAIGTAVRTVLVGFHDRALATGQRCATEGEWRAGLAVELARAGVQGWRVEADQVEDGRHCYGLGEIVPVSRTILLVGVPGDASIGCDPRTGC